MTKRRTKFEETATISTLLVLVPSSLLMHLAIQQAKEGILKPPYCSSALDRHVFIFSQKCNSTKLLGLLPCHIT